MSGPLSIADTVKFRHKICNLGSIWGYYSSLGHISGIGREF